MWEVGGWRKTKTFDGIYRTDRQTKRRTFGILIDIMLTLITHLSLFVMNNLRCLYHPQHGKLFGNGFDDVFNL